MFDIDGACHCLHHESYEVLQPAPGEMELDVERVWQACEACLSRCARDAKGKIDAISVSSQGEAIFPVNREGRPLHHAIVTFDARAEGQARHLREAFREHTKNTFLRPIHSMFSAPKLLWLHQQEIDHDAWRYMLFADYAVFKLCGEAFLDYGLSGRTLLFDTRNLRWFPEMLDACGIKQEQLSIPVPSGTGVGKVLPEAAERMGFSENVRVVTGGHDQQCCAFGVGVQGSGVVMDTLGTTESILCVSAEPRYDDRLAGCGIPCDVFVREGYYAYLGFLTTSGQALDWLHRKVWNEAYDKEALSTFGREPSGLLVLPHFAGSGTPWLDEQDRGIVYGLTNATTPQQFYKGMMEGAAFEARVNVDLMRECGLAVDEIRVTGGGASNRQWLNAKADIYGMPLTLVAAKETGALGAAMLAARGMGAVSAEESPWVRIHEVIQPDPGNVDRYAEAYAQYQKLMKTVERWKKNE